MRTVADVIGRFAVPPLLAVLAGQLYAEALVFGAHGHNLPKPGLRCPSPHPPLL